MDKDTLGNFSGYNGLRDNIISSEDDLGVVRAKQAAQMSWLAKNQKIEASTDASIGIGDTIQFNSGSLVVKSIIGTSIVTEGGITVPFSDAKVTEKAVIDGVNKDNNDSSVIGKSDIVEQNRQTRVNDENVSVINSFMYYSRYSVDKINCYVVNNVTGRIIEFLISPEDISDSMSSTFDDIQTRGRTSPIKGFSNSGPREISFSIILHDDYCKEGILATVRHLQALTLPGKTDGFIKAPSCKVVIGKFINIVGICTSVSVNWKKPYHNNQYSNAEISLSFTETQSSSIFASEWEARL